MTPCAAQGCSAPGTHLGACPKHYKRFKKWGSYDLPLRVVLSPEERFWRKVDRSGECWLWTAGLSGTGYAHFLPDGRNGRRVLAHRYAWEISVGPIPDGLHIDHLCRTRACVRPDHLEPVTQAENNRRAVAHRFGPRLALITTKGDHA